MFSNLNFPEIFTTNFNQKTLHFTIHIVWKVQVRVSVLGSRTLEQ